MPADGADRFLAILERIDLISAELRANILEESAGGSDSIYAYFSRRDAPDLANILRPDFLDRLVADRVLTGEESDFVGRQARSLIESVRTIVSHDDAPPAAGDWSSEPTTAGEPPAGELPQLASVPSLAPRPAAASSLGLGVDLTPPRTPDFPPEPVIPKSFGKYTLVGEIARGGMGIVFLAEQPELARKVALKIVLGQHREHPQIIKRFQREAKAAGRLHHPGIVPVFDYGEFAGFHYFTMDYVPGPTLAGYLKGRSPSPRESAELLVPICEAIYYSHTNGIVHRDLKPSNILIAMDPETKAPVPKLTDFGLAREVEEHTHLTHTGAVIGTPSFMAPEQVGGRDIGPSIDIHGLGTILYFCLTLRPPFSGASLPEVLHKVVSQEPASPRAENPLVGRDLERICLKALQKRPEDRYPDARRMGEDLRAYLEGREVSVRPLAPWERLYRWAARNRSLAAALACILLLAGCFAAWVIHQARQRAAELADLGARAQAEAEAGRPRQALALIEKALLLDPGDPALAGMRNLCRNQIARLEREKRRKFAREERAQEASYLLRWARALRDQLDAASDRARRRRTTMHYLLLLQQALGLDPDLEGARKQILDHHLAGFLEAERLGDLDEARWHHFLVLLYDRNRRYAQILERDSRLDVAATADGASYSLYRYGRSADGRLVTSGKPLKRGLVSGRLVLDLPPGSYLVDLQKAGFAAVRVPVSIPRLGGVRLRIPMVKPGEIPRGAVYVPPGPYTAGAPVTENRHMETHPFRILDLKGFFIKKTEVTLREYREFVDRIADPGERRRRIPHWVQPDRHGNDVHIVYAWRDDVIPGERISPLSPELPVVGVSLEDAIAYCRWLSSRSRFAYRVADEKEWEKAARGADGRAYPWGFEFRPHLTNLSHTTPLGPRPPGSFGLDRSPYGCMDMAGNVAEWCASLFDAANRLYTIKGGGWTTGKLSARSAYRVGANERERNTGLGFRWVVSGPQWKGAD